MGKHRFYTIFDLIDAFKAEQAEENAQIKRQRNIFVELEDRNEALDLMDRLGQPLNCLKDATILDADGKTEHAVLEIGFLVTDERYGYIKAWLEFKGLAGCGKATEVKKDDEKKENKNNKK